MRIIWTPEKEKMLGTLPDAELGKKLGVSNFVIRHRRIKLGIPAFDDKKSKQSGWTKKELSLFGVLSDCEIARITGRHKSAVQAARTRRSIEASTGDIYSRKWSDEEVALLGKMKDVDVSAITGRSTASIFQKRKSMGISRFKKS